MQHGYNLLGQMTSINLPHGRVVSQNVDAIGRLSSVSDGTTTYLNNLSCNAAGATGRPDVGQRYPGRVPLQRSLAARHAALFSANNGQIASIRYFTAPGEQNEDEQNEDLRRRENSGRLWRNAKQ